MKDQRLALLILPSPCITGKSSHGSTKLFAHVDISKLRPRARPYHARIVVLVPDFSRWDGTERPAYSQFQLRLNMVTSVKACVILCVALLATETVQMNCREQMEVI